MNPEAIFTSLCETSDPEARLGNQSDETLFQLHRYLSATHRKAVYGLMLGLVELEIHRRWLEEQSNKSGAMGEGNS